MFEESESYMRGWRSGYHNATLAERKRVLDIIRMNAPEDIAKMLTELINERKA